MSSIKNPLAAILDSNKFTGLNYQDWLPNLNIVLASEKLLYTLEKSPPKEAPADISPEELTKLNQCPSQLGGRHSNPVVTTPTIALDFSGTTQQSASHNVAPNQNLTTGTHASYNKPDATIQSQQSSRNNPVANIQSQQSSRKALNQKLVDSSQLEPDAILEMQRFNLTRRRRVAPSTGSSIPQLVTQSQYNSSRDWFFNSSTGHSLTSATTARRNTSATTDFPFPPAASYSNHKIPNPTSRWLQYG
ncbi:hypothetical protein F511_21077 [Dorcoceras hygrometricum]|uniref:Uncharacterized protein n=1 Tax=Dorcoceras hygrometricum TaxID=472368 RepID=A0A2Z7AKM4_9LAMI|nr:hypothetical protein F511_21077 [Dorcoceras hygrometricum]